MSKLFLFLLIAVCTATANAQVNPVIWDSVTTVTTDTYELKVPHTWQQVNGRGLNKETMVVVSAEDFRSLFNDSVNRIVLYVEKLEGNNLDACKERCFKNYRESPDRKITKQTKVGEQKLRLSSGQDAYLLNTHYTRKSTAFVVSHFDLVVYSDKAQTGYSYSFIIQYSGNAGTFEANNQAEAIAKKLYSFFIVK